MGVTARIDQREALKLSSKLMDYLTEKGLSAFLDKRVAERIKNPYPTLPLNKMKTDLIITIGGDGTILRTCLEIPKPEPPILSINMGVRGFLTEVHPKDAFKAIDKCLEGKFKIEKHTKLASFIGKKRLPDALNEVCIVSKAPVKLLYLKVWRNGVLVGDCRSDGVIIASQVGSTGYSLSAGGPVLDPQVEAFVLTPICPLSDFHPIVFSSNSSIAVELLKPEKAFVVIDGHYRTEAKADDRPIIIKESEFKSSFIRFEENFYHRLKERTAFSRGREF